ncbi:MAG: FKBP-type peptidyl-prolyl cis-trans isomerase [Bacteroidia bacterium]|nr:FKBP-type peptidyl-prolyl cis-trans isomerase [Bacteroidia bacterium]
MKKVFFLIFLAAFAVGCGNSGNSGNGNQPRFDNTPTITETPAKFTPWTVEDSSKIVRSESGLGIYTVLKGPGNLPQNGTTVIVHYHGTLENGTVFDSSFDRGQPFQFKLGVGQVIKGWDEGIAKLPFGSKAILFVPADLAYGAMERPNIPANSPLIFYVELLGSF